MVFLPYEQITMMWFWWLVSKKIVDLSAQEETLVGLRKALSRLGEGEAGSRQAGRIQSTKS